MAFTMHYARVAPTTVAFVAFAAFASACAPEASTPPTAAGAASTVIPAAPTPPPSVISSPPPTASVSSAAPGVDDLVGKTAPDFTATAQDGKAVHLAALRGKTVVIYFYPKDETPGCTKEACSFRDAWQAIAKTGAVLVGISGDDRESHKAFTEHYSLPFFS
jgi:hypothetical protein